MPHVRTRTASSECEGKCNTGRGGLPRDGMRCQAATAVRSAAPGKACEAERGATKLLWSRRRISRLVRLPTVAEEHTLHNVSARQCMPITLVYGEPDLGALTTHSGQETGPEVLIAAKASLGRFRGNCM
eukprot:1314103-Rhodomonas_salina.1